MKGGGKFCHKSYQLHDWQGKMRWLKHLDSNGFQHAKIDFQYGIDIEAVKNDQVYRYEVEIKKGYPWTSQKDFMFDTVNFLARKKKFGSFYYVIMAHEGDSYILCHSDIIYNDENKKVSYTFRGTDEFYEVKKELCVFGQLSC